MKQEIRDWRQAVEILCRYNPQKVHLDDILDKNPPLRIRWLLMEVFRQWMVIDQLLKSRLKRLLFMQFYKSLIFFEFFYSF